jgi:hypothetical protein
MPEFIQSNIKIEDLAKTPTDEVRALVTEALRQHPEAEQGSLTVGETAAELHEILKADGHDVDVMQIVGALKGL